MNTSISLLRLALLSSIALFGMRLTAAAAVPERVLGLGTLNGVTLSPNGKVFVTSGSRGVIVWDLETGQPLRFLSPEFACLDANRWDCLWGETRGATVVFSGDGSRVLVGGRDATGRLYDTQRWTLLAEFSLGGADWCSPVGYALSSNGNRVAIGSAHNLALWEVQESRKVFELSTGGERLDFSSDGATLICDPDVRNPGPIELRDAASGALITSVAHEQSPLAVDLSPDGTMLAALSCSNPPFGPSVVHFFTIPDGTLLSSFDAGVAVLNDNDLGTIMFSPDGEHLLTSDARLFECRSGSLVRSFDVQWRRAARASFSADGNRLLMAAPWSAVPGLQVWNLESGTVERAYYGHDTGGEASFSPDGQTVLVGGQLWSVPTGELLHVFSARGRTAITSDGRMAVTETFTNKVALWDLATKQLIRTFECPAAETAGLALSADGRLLAITGSRNVEEPSPAVALLYALDNGTLVRTIDIPRDAAWASPGASPVFSPDGAILAVGRTFDVVLWQVDSGESNRVFQLDYFVQGCAFSPDGTRFAAVSGGTRSCHLWDLATGQELRRWAGSGMDVKFSPDGRFLLVGGLLHSDGYNPSRILSLTTGQELRLFPPTGSVAWSPDGKHVLLDFFGVSTLWDVRDILADLRVVNSQAGLEVRWDTGTLQYAATVDGNWTDLPVTSPLRLSTIGKQGYFRAIVQ